MLHRLGIGKRLPSAGPDRIGTGMALHVYRSERTATDARERIAPPSLRTECR
jgi:hypothetical protein